MKQFYIFLMAFGLLTRATAQTTSGFEEMILAPESYYDGSDFSGGMNSGNAFFYNRYDTTWGASFGYWAEGWAISNKYDSITQASDYATQLYSAREFSDADEKNFAVGTQGSRIVLTGAAAGKSVGGFYITNSTYAYNSMKLGDAFAKKFGGTSGNDPDYFKLVIKKYLGGSLGTDSVEFYLADYRFTDNTQDYIINEWTWVSLTVMGNVDSLEFVLRSSDVGSFGMNTPAYYCIDDFTTNDSPAVIEEAQNIPVKLYPNPCVNTLYLTTGIPGSAFSITDMNGKQVSSGNFRNTAAIDVSALPAGMYCVQVNGKTARLIKE